MTWWSWSAAFRLLLAAGAAEAAGPLGEPFQVNAYTTGLQAV